MSITFHKVQEFYCGALKDVITSEQSVHPFMYSLFGVMSMPTKAEDDSRIYCSGSDPRTMNLIDKALLCLGMMMEVLPDDMNVIPYTVQFVNETISSWSPHTRKAACLAVAVIADSDRADKECLQKLLPLVTTCISDWHPAVRNAALCALGQLHSNKDISLQCYEELLVPLLHCLRLLSEPLKTASMSKSCELPPPPYIGALFDTIVSFCSEKHDKMESDTFGSYNSKVVQYLLRIVNASCDISILKKAIDAVKEIIRVSIKESAFYIRPFAKFLKTFLKIRPTADLGNILVALLEIFEMMQERLADADFKPLAKKCFQFIMTGIKVFRDYPVLKRVHNLLAKLRVLLDGEMDKIVAVEVIHVSKPKLEERQEHDGKVRNASLVPVGSDDGDFDAGKTQTVNNTASGEIELPDADKHLRRSMSICSVSTVCIVEHEEGTRRGSHLAPKSYEMPRRSRYCGSVCSSNRSGRPGEVELPDADKHLRRSMSICSVSTVCIVEHEEGTRSRSPLVPKSYQIPRRSRYCGSVCSSSCSSSNRSRRRRRRMSGRRGRRSRSSSSSSRSYRRRRLHSSDSSSCSPCSSCKLYSRRSLYSSHSLYSSRRSRRPRRKRSVSRDSFGHIEFGRAEDARSAVLHGSDDPGLPHYNLSFGRGSFRRRRKYQDIDAVASNGNITPQPREESAFDIFLKEAKAASERKRRRHRCADLSSP